MTYICDIIVLVSMMEVFFHVFHYQFFFFSFFFLKFIERVKLIVECECLVENIT